MHEDKYFIADNVNVSKIDKGKCKNSKVHRIATIATIYHFYHLSVSNQQQKSFKNEAHRFHRCTFDKQICVKILIIIAFYTVAENLIFLPNKN